MLCDGMCVDPGSSEHCGGCGRRCVGGSYCHSETEAGPYACQCADDPTYESLCRGVCTSLRTLTDCGACGNACPTGSRCREYASTWQCLCDGGESVVCGGACVPVDTDNCGACGMRCEGFTPICGRRMESDAAPTCLPRYDVETGAMPIVSGGGAPTDFELTGIPIASVPATLTVTAAGDFGDAGESASISLGSRTGTVAIGTFTHTVVTCGWVTRTFAIADVSSFVQADGTMIVRFAPTAAVGSCGTMNQVFVRLAI
jgi:hypothetical protein